MLLPTGVTVSEQVPIAEQAPRCSIYESELSTAAAAAAAAPIGTHVVSVPVRPPIRIVSEDPITAKPVYEAPASAGPVNDHVSTTSAQSGSNPGPIPPVGTLSPQACSCVPASCSAAPKNSTWGGLALFAGILIALWLFAGFSLRRFL